MIPDNSTRPRVLMIGTSRTTQGGVSAVVNVYEASGLFERCRVHYLDTHCDGSAWRKLAVACGALLSYMLALAVRRPALVHIHASSRASFWRKTPFIALARLVGVPYIIHLHAGRFHIFYGQELGPAARRLVRWCFLHAARVVVLSEGWRAWVQDAMPGVRAVVIHNPVLAQPPPEARQREDATILFLGRLGQAKGTLDLLEAVALIAGRWPGLCLQLGGDGDIEEARARAAELGIGGQVQLLGWVRGEAKSDLLNNASIYVLPSYQEGLPMSVLEAMAAGLPVVSTPVGGIPEAVRDGQEGFLVAPGDVPALADRLERLLANRDLRHSMGRAALQRVQERFVAEAVLPKVEAMYNEIAPPHAARR